MSFSRADDYSHCTETLELKQIGSLKASTVEYLDPMNSGPIPFRLAELLNEARERTLALVADLDDEQMIGPR